MLGREIAESNEDEAAVLNGELACSADRTTSTNVASRQLGRIPRGGTKGPTFFSNRIPARIARAEGLG